MTPVAYFIWFCGALSVLFAALHRFHGCLGRRGLLEHKLRFAQIRGRPCGLMDKALVLGTKDCRFESCQGHALYIVAFVRLCCSSALEPF